MLTTFTSYGALPVHRQGDLIRKMTTSQTAAAMARGERIAALEAMLTQMKSGRSSAYTQHRCKYQPFWEQIFCARIMSGH